MSHDTRLDNLEKGTYKLVHENQTIEVPVGQSVNNPRQKEPVSVNAVVSGEIEKANFKKPTAVFYNTLDGSEFGRFNFADDAEVQTQGKEITDIAKGLLDETDERKREDEKIREEITLVETELTDVAKGLLDETAERKKEDGLIHLQVDTVKSEVVIITKALLDETAERKKEDTNLQTQINNIKVGEVTREEFTQEIEDRKNGDTANLEKITTVEENLNKESEDRKRNENLIDERIEEEVKKRVEKDNAQDESLRLEIQNRREEHEEINKSLNTIKDNNNYCYKMLENETYIFRDSNRFVNDMLFNFERIDSQNNLSITNQTDSGIFYNITIFENNILKDRQMDAIMENTKELFPFGEIGNSVDFLKIYATFHLFKGGDDSLDVTFKIEHYPDNSNYYIFTEIPPDNFLKQ